MERSPECVVACIDYIETSLHMIKEVNTRHIMQIQELEQPV